MKTLPFTTMGIDLGKNSVHVVAMDGSGSVVLRKRLSHGKLVELLANTPSCLVGMEACPGSNHLGRVLTSLGHTVRLIPAQYVKPYVKTNKNDALDAEAIAEAVGRPTMRFVPIKTIAQVDLQTMHRIRDRMVCQRTSLISQIRCFLLEYGIVMAAGVAAFKRDLPKLLGEQEEQLSHTLKLLIGRLREELRALEERIDEISREIQDFAAKDDTARRLMTIPGVGALGATAFLAAVGDAPIPQGSGSGRLDRLGPSPALDRWKDDTPGN